MKQFEISVIAHSDFLTVDGSSVKLTKVATEILAHNESDLIHQLNEFLTEVRPFHGLPTGTTRERADEIVNRRKMIVEELNKFIPTPCNLWTVISVSKKFHFWEINLEFQGEL